MTTTNNDLEELDAQWANFRLPVPLAPPRRGSKFGNYSGDITASSSSSFANKNDEWMLELLDLLRLLYTMDRQYANKNRDCFTSSKKIMASQMTLAYSTLSRVERTCPYSQENIPTDEVSGDQILEQNIFILLQKARNYTEETCVKFQRWLDRPMPHPAQKYQKKQGSPEERDLIYDIFLAPASTSTSMKNSEHDDTETLDEITGDEEYDAFDETAIGNDPNKQLNVQSQRQQSIQSSSSRLPPPKEMDPVEFQKQQQELLEEELASMASRLKSSTLAMNATLQTQTKELDNMEQLAQTNLDQVTDTTKKVEARLARTRGWKKNLATWGLIGTVMGVWTLCFMVMRIAPKRKIGKVNLLDNLRHGRNRVKDTWTRYFSKYDEDEMSRDDEAYWQEEQEEHPEERHTNNDRQQEQQRTENECEVHTDGTQTCYDSTERVAQDIVAERKRRQIEENMANAPVVDALEPDSPKGTTHDAEEIQRKKVEAARLEEERLVADTQHKVQEKLAEEARLEAQRLERERQAQEARLEAERLEQERLREEAAKQAEDERVRQEILTEEARLEADRLEQEKAEFERLDRESLAIEATNQAEEAKKRIRLEAEAGAREATEHAKQFAASDYAYFAPADVRSAAGRLNGNDLLAYCILMAPEMIEDSDKIGWRPIHEAARAGNLVGIQLLISSGVDLTSRTGRKGNGGTALWWAIQRFGEDHSAVQLLRHHGALDIGPEL